MCHPPGGRAPAPPARAEIAEHGPVGLVSADGSPVPAYRALPARPGRGRVVLLPDVRGLHSFYRDLACRFAEAGFSTLAIDLYGRTAGHADRDADFPWRDHVGRVLPEQVDADVQAALDHLAAVDPGPAFTVGFCFGGGHSWRLAGTALGLAGAIGFYGLPHLVTGTPGPDSAPVLLLLAGRDDETPPAAYRELVDRLDGAGAPHEVHTYPDAPHSFFDRTAEQWADTCRDAWDRLLDFTDRRSPDPLLPTLPARYYTDQEVFDRERERVFGGGWMCLDRTEAVAAPGSFAVHEVAGESVLLLRGKDGALRAFHNVCRHRGARLCTEPAGTLRKSVRCSYHGWSYGLDGRLAGAPSLAQLPRGTRERYGLLPVRLTEWLGYAWVNLDGRAPPLAETASERAAAVLGDEGKLVRYRIAELRRVRALRYDVAANWKTLTENFMECYHCAPLHPELTAVLPQFASGRGTLAGGGRGAAFAPGTGYSLSGRAAGPRLPGLRPDDDQLHALVLFPSAFVVLTPDHVAVYRLQPRSADRTTLVVDTLFAADQADRPDFDPDDTVALRDVTVRQDIEAVERCQLGMRSRAYEHGVLVPAEHAVLGFYRDLLGALGEPIRPEHR
jgi:Rieske 2Fe-2S family protein